MEVRIFRGEASFCPTSISKSQLQLQNYARGLSLELDRKGIFKNISPPKKTLNADYYLWEIYLEKLIFNIYSTNIFQKANKTVRKVAWPRWLGEHMLKCFWFYCNVSYLSLSFPKQESSLRVL